MTIANWIQANSIWIALVISVLLLIYFVIGIIKIIRTGRSIISPLAVILLILGLMFLIFLIFNTSEIKGAAWAEILLLIGLVTITAVYANANVKMAEEMREQRYNALRPIIDIVEQPTESKEKMKQGFDAKEGEFPKDLLCKLRNVGVGPAIEVYSFIEDTEDAGGKPRRWDFGTIPVAVGEEEMGYTNKMRLLLEQRGSQRALVAYYKDVYDNLFESVREVSVDKDKEAVNVGPLKVRSLPKQEHSND